MKSKDLLPLIAASVVAVIISWIASSIIIKNPPLTREIDEIEPINSEFEVPKKLFDKNNSIDTFVPTEIGS